MSSADARDPHDDEEGGEAITVTNEFTSVRVRKVKTGNGERLEISSLRVPHTVRLDALVLESLTWRPLEDIAKGLETPFGSEDEQPGEDSQ